MASFAFRKEKGSKAETCPAIVSEGCPILRQIYALHCIVSSSRYNTEQKHNNKERSKTMRSLTKPCINLSEYWTSMLFLRSLLGMLRSIVFPAACNSPRSLCESKLDPVPLSFLKWRIEQPAVEEKTLKNQTQGQNWTYNIRILYF